MVEVTPYKQEEWDMREKIAEIMRDYPRLGSMGVTEQLYEKIAERILSLIHSEMVELVPAEKRVSKLGNLAENDRYEGYNLLRSELLSAIEKKFGGI